MILYLVLWLILISKFNIEGFVIGLFVSLIVFRANKSRSVIDIDGLRIIPYKVITYIRYTLILIWEIFVAGIDVARIVLSIKPNISPCTIEYKTKVRSNLRRMLLCNSITLTPGTLTIDIVDDVIIVHCLTEKNALDLENNIFERLLLDIEKKEKEILNG